LELLTWGDSSWDGMDSNRMTDDVQELTAMARTEDDALHLPEEIRRLPQWEVFQEYAERFWSEVPISSGQDESLERPLHELYQQVLTLFPSVQKVSAYIVNAFVEYPADPAMRLQSFASFRLELERRETAGEALSPEAFRRHIQWQMRLRLALGACLGVKAFVKSWVGILWGDLPPKRRRRIKKESNFEWKLCLTDMTSLFSLAFLKAVPPGPTHAAAFLTSCGLDLPAYSEAFTSPTWKNRLVKEIWTFFDLCEGPTVLRKATTPQPSAVLPPLEIKPLVQPTKARVDSNGKENTLVPLGRHRVSLTTRVSKKQNSLLGKTGRSRFVGSHFNTNLTNTSALFRSVRTALPPSKATLTAVRPPRTIVTTQKRGPSRPSVAMQPPPRRRVSVEETPAPVRRKRSRVIWETPEKCRGRPKALPM
jgi:hypothetical protein